MGHARMNRLSQRFRWRDPAFNRSILKGHEMKLQIGVAVTCYLSLISTLSASPATTRASDPRNMNAIGHAHSSAVPQVDRRGQTITKFDPSRSMMVIGAWGEPVFDPSTPGTGIDWKDLAAAGFNTVWTDWSNNPKIFQQAKDANLQVVLSGQVPIENLKQIQKDPNLMCIVWKDEPSGQPDQPGLWKAYQTYKQQAHDAAPSVPALFREDQRQIAHASADSHSHQTSSGWRIHFDDRQLR
jgi:hypothetical protein